MLPEGLAGLPAVVEDDGEVPGHLDEPLQQGRHKVLDEGQGIHPGVETRLVLDDVAYARKDGLKLLNPNATTTFPRMWPLPGP